MSNRITIPKYTAEPGERPFGSATNGIAWDGRNLWALDTEDDRICIIEKTESGKEITTAQAAKRGRGE